MSLGQGRTDFPLTLVCMSTLPPLPLSVTSLNLLPKGHDSSSHTEGALWRFLYFSLFHPSFLSDPPLPILTLPTEHVAHWPGLDLMSLTTRGL